MLSSLKNHPFAVEAFFDYSLVLTYALPKTEVEHLIPACLRLDTFNDQWAFVALALVQTKSLRPKGFPEWLGSDFFLIGYRIFVRYTTRAGKQLRGLYILQSETDQKSMEWLGALFTRYRYNTTDITQTTTGTILTVSSKESGLTVAVDITPNMGTLPASSPFDNWKEARRFAGPLPFTFSYDSRTDEVLIVEGTRQHWQPTPVCILQAESTFFKTASLSNYRLASAFLIRDVPYIWKRGRTEQWNQ